jgi:hypothetical protein
MKEGLSDLCHTRCSGGLERSMRAPLLRRGTNVSVHGQQARQIRKIDVPITVQVTVLEARAVQHAVVRELHEQVGNLDAAAHIWWEPADS